MWIASGLATTIALLIGLTSGTWAQSPGSVSSTSPPPAAPGSTAGSILTLGFLAVIVIAIIAVARYVATRRKRIDDAAILQSQISNALAREAQLQGLVIIPTARVSGWRGAQLTIEVTGQVPTPDLRETVMRIVSAEALRLRPGVITVDRLIIAPPARPTSNSLASRR
jgi:hypothetical protein